ncbi:MAG: DUF3837 family protein [Brotaphodocola sp.]
MIYSIVRQSIEIRLRFEQVPKIYADSECAAAIGILAKKCGLPLPVRREDFHTMKEELKQQIAQIPETEEIAKLKQILFPYDPKESVTDEMYDLMTEAYENT